LLVSRPAFASALLAQIPAGRVARADLTPYHARQIRRFNDPELTARLGQVWGELREPAADKQAFIATLRTELAPVELERANRSQGRVLYQSLCAACHTLYGQGAALGPDLTGAGRDNLDYLLENIVDPGAVVTADYRMNVLKLKDGRTLTGFIAARTARTLTIRGPGESHTVERDEIATTEESPDSVMPAGLLESLTPAQRRDLIAYLMHPTQVPLP
ncbi:MAG: c-type cytochrome, partial [Opitutaceae bacterium]|nr:c-type cytochrome [Opitutaceae bacterium]